MSEVVTIAGIAAGGEGVGHLADGRAVFVPRTAPGDSISLRSVRLHRSFARGEIAQVLRPGPARVTPPCPHYAKDQCGGCQLQQLAYDAQLEAKRAIVGGALRRIGKLDVADPDIVEAIDEWRYRSNITLTVSGGRGAAKLVGMHPYGRPGSVFPLIDCHVADFRLMELWRDVKQHLNLFPPRLSRLTLRLDREGRTHVIAESQGAPWQHAEALRAAVSGTGDGVTCWWQPVDGAARVMAGPVTGFPPTAFEQVNAEMATLARAWGVDQLGDQRGRVVWDLYGGIGDTAVLLAERGAEVVSVDVDEKAIGWARRRPLPPSGGSVRFIAARAEDVLATLPEPHAALVNPPRAGLHWNVTLKLREQPVDRLTYISRDPATLARDLQRLSVNYRVVAMRAFDLFPQTSDVETVVVLEAA